MEKKTLKPLPPQRYTFAEWFQETTNGGYHVCIYKHYYSIPYKYSYKEIESRATNNVIECFYKDNKIASHKRDDSCGEYSTLPEHMPEAHRQQAQWNKTNLIAWATNIGPNTLKLIANVLSVRHRHLKKKERSALGILRLSNSYDENNLELACGKALELGTNNYRTLESILNKKTNPTQQKSAPSIIIQHENIRGNDEYH